MLLPAPLGPTIADQLRLVERQVDVPQHRLAVIGDGDVMDVEDGRHRARSSECRDDRRLGSQS